MCLQDAHNAILNFDKEAAFFGVYDGHGGHEVAEFVAKYFPDHLRQNESYKTGDYEKVFYHHIILLNFYLGDIDISFNFGKA